MSLSHIARPIAALGVGAWLYQAVVVMAGGYFAAIAIPQAYFEFFGREHRAVALALVQLMTFALPVAVLVAGGTLAAAYVLGTHGRFFALVLLGMAVCCVAWIMATLGQVQRMGADEGLFLAQLLMPAWWAWPAQVSPWVGVALAVWVSRRRLSRDA